MPIETLRGLFFLYKIKKNLHIPKNCCIFVAEIKKVFITTMMTKEEKVAYWLDLADYDIEISGPTDAYEHRSPLSGI